LPDLLQTHRGKYVAIHNEQVVDSSDDPIPLIKAVHARFGYVPIHIGHGTVEPEPIHRSGLIRELHLAK
jgi:hypothetical protein